MIGQMAIAVVFPGFNGVGRSVTPQQILFQIISLLSKIEQKPMWEINTISIFLFTRHQIRPPCSCKARETMIAK